MGREIHKGPPLYFLGILPDAHIQAEVTAFKQYAREHFRTGRALRSPPHITLIPPFHWKKEEALLLGACARFAREAARPAFAIRLRDFDAFPPRVIFVYVEPNARLIALQEELEQLVYGELGISNSSKYPFHPHMTVAFKDLSKPKFSAAWAYFSRQSYRRSFTSCSFWLLQNGPGGWSPVREFAWADCPSGSESPLSP
jgi:2'-5' RNA ligase